MSASQLSLFAVHSQRHCITISKLTSSSPHGKDITCHQKAGFARTMICLSRLVIELCLLLNIMWKWQRIKGDLGTCKACLPKHSQDCLGTVFLLCVHSLEGPAFPRTWTLTIRLTSPLFDPGPDPRSFLTLNAPPHHCSCGQPLRTQFWAVAWKGQEE